VMTLLAPLATSSATAQYENADQWITGPTVVELQEDSTALWVPAAERYENDAYSEEITEPALLSTGRTATDAPGFHLIA